MKKRAQIILISNCIFDASGSDPFSGYVALGQETILEVGPGKPDADLIVPDTKIYDLGDQTVCPGFADAHTFFTGWSLNHIGADLTEAANKEEIIALAKQWADSHPNRPVWGHGWNPSIETGGQAALDNAFGSVPAILFAQGAEAFWMNQAAIDRYGFDYSADCNEVFWKLMEEILDDHEFIEPLFVEYMHMLNSRGITSVKEIGYDTFSSFTDILEKLEKEDRMTLRVNFMSQPVKEGANMDYGRAMRDRFQGDFVCFSGYNRMTDGSISQLCGFLKEPYLCSPDTVCAQFIDWDLIRNEVLSADAEGFRFSLNAQGDASVAHVLDIFDECQKTQEGRVKNRQAVTEAEFSDPVDLERMGRMGVVCEFYPQIQAIADWNGKVGMILEKLGEKRSAGYWNRRKMADSGVPLACGTDLPLVIDNIPQSLYHSVTGKFPEGGKAFHPENTLTVKEVLLAWTSGGAYDMCHEETLGKLVPGMKADIAVFDGNLFTTPIDDIRKRKVVLTFVNGQPVYEA